MRLNCSKVPPSNPIIKRGESASSESIKSVVARNIELAFSPIVSYSLGNEELTGFNQTRHKLHVETGLDAPRISRKLQQSSKPH